MKPKKALVLNILFETPLRTSFDNRIAQAFQPLEIPYETVHLEDLGKIGDMERYTHLLISGSTESAAGENTWYAELDSLLRHFINNEKSILAICFGHQFLVRHILGKHHVRKSPTPEIGWADITLSDNPIFKNMHSLKSSVFHYDEVFDLDDRFEITASSDRCAVHGFQVKGKNIWGVQFHPDFMYQDVFEFAEELEKNGGVPEGSRSRTEVSPEEFRENDQIFKNWFEIS